ncbi:MAG TPA: CheR family methyltransferase [Anaeromyxobacter sp.]|nr:CheR family methyltransferase [Anaeromyxobacter sp.]
MSRGGHFLERAARARVFGGTPMGRYLRINEAVWARLPPKIRTLRPVESYGRLLHALVLAHGRREMFHGTFFFRNRPELELICRLAVQRGTTGEQVKLAVVGCSNGAEVYSIGWTIRSAHPSLNLLVNAVDISPEVIQSARDGVYPLGVDRLVREAVLARVTPEEMDRMFEVAGGVARIRPWLKEGIAWHQADAADPRLAVSLGLQDIVIANRLLCHLEPAVADRVLRAIARLVAPGGYLFVSGVDLDVRMAVAESLRWSPVLESMRELHEGDISLRLGWPTKYWGLEPFDAKRSDWQRRYASVFQVA